MCSTGQLSGRPVGSGRRCHDSVEKRLMIHLLVPHNFSISLGGRACFIISNKSNLRLYDLTGLVGLGVPRECLLDTDVDVVQTVGRTPTGYSIRRSERSSKRMSTDSCG